MPFLAWALAWSLACVVSSEVSSGRAGEFSRLVLITAAIGMPCNPIRSVGVARDRSGDLPKSKGKMNDTLVPLELPDENVCSCMVLSSNSPSVSLPTSPSMAGISPMSAMRASVAPLLVCIALGTARSRVASWYY